ncbi:MAG: GNAT family N-acetyltransferase [Firmicutes bacterium]|nr:GNAT family N-acetyltransferase [Bacillota bacterium]
MDELYVRPRHRGVGLGRRFMEYVATLPDIRALSLAVTLANQRAYSWYRSLGFRPETNRILSKNLGRYGDGAAINGPGN